jgi:aldehyde dehydrogenase (NAD+)
VAQELGGKSPNIVLDDDAFAKGVGRGVASMMPNSGQSCNAPTRMLVPSKRMDEAIAVARETAAGVTVGDPNGNSQLGPVVNKTQFDKIQKLIQAGIDEGATLVIGGTGRPEGPRQGLLCEAHGLRQRHQRHDHRQGRDLRPGAVDPWL